MSQPVWITPAGDLGTYNVGVSINISLSANATFPGSYLEYKFLGGELPNGVTIDRFGNLTGIPINVLVNSTSTFIVRVTDEFNNVRDRTFTLTLINSARPKITTLPGQLLNVVDSTYVNYPIQYVNNSSSKNITFSVLSGYLPDGLYLDPVGIIKGYPKKPVLGDNSPSSVLYTFTILLSSNAGNDSASFSIQVRNHLLSNTPNTRIPAIINRKPLTEPIDSNDPYHDYYLLNNRTIPAIKTNEYFSFKIIGIDFDNNNIEYQFGGLPPGLVGNSTTGWITGYPTEIRKTISTYDIQVTVAKKNSKRNTIVSPPEIFRLTVKNDVLDDIVWNTDSDLGTIYNGSISMLSLSASATEALVYDVVDGTLPKNLILLDNGEIVGRVAEQPDMNRVLAQGESTEFIFTVRAFSRTFPLLTQNKQFKITVYQRYPNPLENIYFKAFPNKHGKQVINSLLLDTSLIPNEYLYRPNDIYFGKATDVRFVHVYGMEATSVTNYINAIQQNHYERKIRLGELKTAVATDDVGNIIYEVVYSTIIDELENGRRQKDKISLTIPINLRLGPWVTNNNEILIDSTIIKISASPGTTKFLYPAGLQNMRSAITTSLPQNFDSNLLPLWMTSQQPNAKLNSTLGYVSAWVICYTKPGYSDIIKNNIESNWKYLLNEVDFTIDRFIVDKSATYNWNTNLTVPSWTDLPSATPAPDPLDSNDAVVLFTKKTILPNS